MTISRIIILVLISVFMSIGCKEKPMLQAEKVTTEQSFLEEKQFPYEKLFITKNFPYKTPDYKAYKSAKESLAKESKMGKRSTGQWKIEGPGNIGARVNTLAVNPENSDEIIAGFASGGVFKTINNGSTWNPIFDDQVDLNIGEVTYDPNNPSTIYVGTGDPNISGYPKIGSGIFKSEDGGDTWTNKGLEEASIISRIHVSASDSDVIYVSTMGIPFIKTIQRGVYKSVDGGDTWAHKLMINDSTGVIDMIVHPENHNIVYAAGWNRLRSDSKSRIVGPDARIHKSVDGGDTWTMLEGGLPITDQLGRIGLAMSGQNYDNLYASYVNTGGSDSCSAAGSQLLGVWKSTDAGESWSEINTLPESGLPCNILGGFAWYFGQLRVNPNDDNDIFILGVDMWRTRDGGMSWDRAVPPWFTYEVHADKHDLIWDGNRMLLGTDGGIYHSLNEGAEWIDIENIPTTQFYRVGYNPHNPDWSYGGAQDNGTTGGNAEIINEWPRIFGGDGFTVAFDPIDDFIFYVATQNGGLRVSFDNGLSFEGATTGLDFAESTNWDTPYFISSHDPKVLYTGRESIYRGVNDGLMVEWTKISDVLIDTIDTDNYITRNISTLHQSPIVEDYLYAGTTDGMVWSSVDGGISWDNISEGVPYRYVSDIVASPSVPNRAYVSVTGYKSNDFVAHLHRTDDNGQNWTSISGDLPEIAINDIFVHPEYDDMVIFVATDGGIYFTENGGVSWNRLGDNMPIVEVYDMAFNPIDNELIAGTFARGIQSFDLSQIGLDGNVSDVKEVSAQAVNLFPSLTDSRISATWDAYDFDRYTVISMDGRVIDRGIIDNLALDLDVSHYKKGNYIITFESGQAVVSKQFVKI